MKSATQTLKKEVIPSLRKCKEENVQIKLSGITPEFQEYLAKYLSIILEEKLEKSTECVISNKKKKKKCRVGGIKLFSSSNNFIEFTGFEVNINKYSKNKKKHLKEIPVSKEDFKNLAVSGNTILQKEDVKYWSNRNKGKVFCYRKNNDGQLIFIE